jgi:hypothetical protein
LPTFGKRPVGKAYIAALLRVDPDDRTIEEGIDSGCMMSPLFRNEPHVQTINRALCAPHKRKPKMKRTLTITLTLLCVLTIVTAAVNAQNSVSGSSTKTAAKQKRGPVFRATKNQINQAQALLKSRGFYGGDQVGKLDDATREGLRKYQQAEGLKVTGTLNKLTLEKMNIALTDKQKTM